MQKTTVINIKGTHCKACKALIEDICLEAGAISCAVDYESGRTVLEHEDNFDLESMKKEIEGLGSYRVED